MRPILKLKTFLTLAIFVASYACSELECPDGLEKVGKVCRRPEAGVDAVGAGDDESESDAAVDSGASQSDAVADAGSVQLGSMDANVDASSLSNVDAATDAAGAVPSLECDDAHPCGSGYSCASGKCTSACAQKRCDLNATCSLLAGTATCTCNAGFIAMMGSGGVTCLRDVACEDLRCSADATCEVGADQLRYCVCKNGYTGDGKTCTPVACPAASTLSIPNGTVTTPNGAQYGQTANYVCSAGYRLMGVNARMCGADGLWIGSAPTCEARDCGALTNPAHGKVDVSGGTTVGSPAAKYSCDTGYTLKGDVTRSCQPTPLGVGWSGAAPACLRCGDGIVSADIGEQCDPAASGSTIWTCDPTACRASAAYRPCLADAQCNSGHTCTAGYCTPRCGSTLSCPAPPSPQMTAFCTSTSPAYCALMGCNAASDCPAGLLCNAGICTGCNQGILPCPAPTTCRTGSDSGYPFQGHCE